MRVAAAVAAGATTAGLLPDRLGQSLRIVAGWDAAALVFGAFALVLFVRATPAATRTHAAAEDPGRAAVSISVLVTCVFSMFATAVALRQSNRFPGETRALFLS